MLTLEKIKKNKEVREFIKQADECMEKMGYTEHGSRHAELVSNISKNILLRLGYPQETAELAAIAGYLHDIGNVVNRKSHPEAGAAFVYSILHRDAPPNQLLKIVTAIGYHEENVMPVDEVAAALVIADKADVHRTRVKSKNTINIDIHDRVNYAATKSFVTADKKKKTITLSIEIDTSISQMMEYFEIFTERMLASNKAAKQLGCAFELVINGVKLF